MLVLVLGLFLDYYERPLIIIILISWFWFFIGAFLGFSLSSNNIDVILSKDPPLPIGWCHCLDRNRRRTRPSIRSDPTNKKVKHLHLQLQLHRHRYRHLHSKSVPRHPKSKARTIPPIEEKSLNGSASQTRGGSSSIACGSLVGSLTGSNTTKIPRIVP
mmetsp:Transcript_57923/g.66859  ORF Transcript_57923/g.66859 Transcript_57923/m.66859 type:complete len:159 (-) Transcript_57923:745-1221(-)